MKARLHDAERLVSLRAMTASGEARRIREAAGLSQPEMARAIDVSATAISRWENGSRTPKGPAALRYATLLERLSRGREPAA